MILPIIICIGLSQAVYSDIPAIPTIAPKGYVCPRKGCIVDDEGYPAPKSFYKPSKGIKVISGVKAFRRYLLNATNPMGYGGYDYYPQPGTITTPNGIFPYIPMGNTGSYYLPMGLPR